MSIYLDNAATTKPYKEVTESMLFVMENCYGNPSSLYKLGLEAAKLLKTSRSDIKKFIDPQNEGRIIITSGGTEANNMALICGARTKKRQGKTIITSRIEHPAVLKTCEYLETEGFKTVYLTVDSDGRVNTDSLKEMLNEDVILISCMYVNNETGAIQPLDELGKIKEEFEKQSGKKLLFHSDEAQSFAKVTRTSETIPQYLDLASYSAHKIHGPKGIGALYMRKELNLRPYIFGGGQEEGLRSGTENTPAAAGFAEACGISMNRLSVRRDYVSAIRARLLEGILSEIKDVSLNSPKQLELASPFILNLSFLGVKGEVLLHELEMKGIYVSTGAACSSKKNNYSHVLKAMGLSETQAEGAIRFSFSEWNSIEEIDKTVAIIKEAVERFRRLGRLR
jgi:cysteine desulfurase